MLVLTTFDLDEYAFGALRAGASGFLLKDVPPAELTGAIRTVASGDAVALPASLADRSTSTHIYWQCLAKMRRSAWATPPSPIGSVKC